MKVYALCENRTEKGKKLNNNKKKTAMRQEQRQKMVNNIEKNDEIVKNILALKIVVNECAQ